MNTPPASSSMNSPGGGGKSVSPRPNHFLMVRLSFLRQGTMGKLLFQFCFLSVGQRGASARSRPFCEGHDGVPKIR